MSHILFAVKRSELLELDTTFLFSVFKVFNHQNDPSPNLDFHVNLQHVKQRIINFFSTPHFFPTCLKHKLEKTRKKTSKNRRNPRQSRPNSTPWGWGWIWISWIQLCCKCPRSRPIPLSIPKIPKKKATLFKRPLTLPFWFEGLGTICWWYFWGTKTCQWSGCFFSVFFGLFRARCLGEDILSQIFRKHIFHLSFFWWFLGYQAYQLELASHELITTPVDLGLGFWSNELKIGCIEVDRYNQTVPEEKQIQAKKQNPTKTSAKTWTKLTKPIKKARENPENPTHLFFEDANWRSTDFFFLSWLAENAGIWSSRRTRVLMVWDPFSID